MSCPEKSMWPLQTKKSAAQVVQDLHSLLVNYKCFPSKFLNICKLLSLFVFPRKIPAKPSITLQENSVTGRFKGTRTKKLIWELWIWSKGTLTINKTPNHHRLYHYYWGLNLSALKIHLEEIMHTAVPSATSSCCFPHSVRFHG